MPIYDSAADLSAYLCSAQGHDTLPDLRHAGLASSTLCRHRQGRIKRMSPPEWPSELSKLIQNGDWPPEGGETVLSCPPTSTPWDSSQRSPPYDESSPAGKTSTGMAAFNHLKKGALYPGHAWEAHDAFHQECADLKREPVAMEYLPKKQAGAYSMDKDRTDPITHALDKHHDLVRATGRRTGIGHGMKQTWSISNDVARNEQDKIPGLPKNVGINPEGIRRYNICGFEDMEPAGFQDYMGYEKMPSAEQVALNDLALLTRFERMTEREARCGETPERKVEPTQISTLMPHTVNAERDRADCLEGRVTPFRSMKGGAGGVCSGKFNSLNIWDVMNHTSNVDRENREREAALRQDSPSAYTSAPATPAYTQTEASGTPCTPDRRGAISTMSERFAASLSATPGGVRRLPGTPSDAPQTAYTPSEDLPPSRASMSRARTPSNSQSMMRAQSPGRARTPGRPQSPGRLQSPGRERAQSPGRAQSPSRGSAASRRSPSATGFSQASSYSYSSMPRRKTSDPRISPGALTAAEAELARARAENALLRKQLTEAKFAMRTPSVPPWSPSVASQARERSPSKSGFARCSDMQSPTPNSKTFPAMLPDAPQSPTETVFSSTTRRTSEVGASPVRQRERSRDAGMRRGSQRGSPPRQRSMSSRRQRYA